MEDSNDKTKVLFISYQFPPKTGPGVIRSMNFCRYLPEYGIKPYVLTLRSEEWERLGLKTDKSLLKNLHPDIEIIRTPAYDRQRSIRFLMKARVFRFFWFFGYPWFWETTVKWSRKVARQAEEIIDRENINIVYTTSGPFSSMLLGRRLQKKKGVKWIADLRDPFTDGYVWQFPSKLHWYIMRKFEKQLFAKPEQLIVNTKAVRDLYVTRGIKQEHEIIVLNNGFSDD